MSFEEPNNPRSSEIVNNQIQLTELATYEERTPGLIPVLWAHSDDPAVFRVEHALGDSGYTHT